MQQKSYWLLNATLETGYWFEDGVARATETALFHIRVTDGSIVEIRPANGSLETDLPCMNAGGLLLIPSFAEMHIHIDKTYFGGPWKACRPVSNIFGRFAEEQELLPKLLPTAAERAMKMLDLLQQGGVTHLRTHCNVDPVIGLGNLEATLHALDRYKERLSGEVVAFPQHGLLRSDSVDLVRQALRHGANLVGAVDPATVDGDIERSLQTLFSLAVEANVGIDLHLHERNRLGLFIMHRLADLTEEAGWQGRVTVSHAFGFANVPAQAAAELADRFAQLQIGITSTVPAGALEMPLPLLAERGVRVDLGNDSITDHWSPFGSGDMLEKAQRLAELYNMIEERPLGEALGYVTRGRTPLNAQGERVWPQVGDEASMVLVDASCTAEAVARRSQRRAVFFRGRLVSGGLNAE